MVCVLCLYVVPLCPFYSSGLSCYDNGHYEPCANPCHKYAGSLPWTALVPCVTHPQCWKVCEDH